MRRIALLGALLIAVLAAALVRGSGPEKGLASSHREAPRIMVDPSADNTDVYAFVSPDRPDTVTIVANYIPLEEPAGGPNFNEFADDVLYELKVDNNGDGREDVSYQFEFSTQTRNGNTFLYNTGPIDTLSDTDWNRPQTYKVTRVSKGKTTILAKGVPTPPVNIGPRSTPNYGSLDAGRGAAVAGRDQGLRRPERRPVLRRPRLGVRPGRPAPVQPRARHPAERGRRGRRRGRLQHARHRAPGPDHAAHRDGKLHAADDMKGVIGVYATASRQRLQIIDSDGRRRSDGDWVQVSRLAEPLINEVVIPLGKKDRWNASDPSGDAAFASHYTSPEVTRLANLLYPVLDNAPESGRGDIATILLTGVPGLNFTGPTQADLIRLNTGIAPSGPVGTGNRLGVLGGDFAGFPNGRRLEDDVTDIELRALTCGYGPTVGPLIESFGFCAGNANRSPNNQLGDGVDANDRPLHTSFPYVAVPHQGYEHVHHSSMGGP